MLFFNLQLKLNNKTQLYWLNQKEDKETILKDLKKVSPEYHLNDADNDENPKNKLANIFDELYKLKKSRIDFSNCSDGTIEADILKEIYEKQVSNLIKKKENINKIEEIFNDFNFNLVNAMPREIIIIVSQHNQVLQGFINFLKSKDKLSVRDAYLILTLLCQHEFKYIDLFEKIKTIESFKPIIDMYEEKSLQSDKPGYFKLSYDKIALLASHTNIIEQIRLRVFNEKIQSYSVALNHLLNEIHAVCMCFDRRNQKSKYEADDVVNYLNSKSVDYKIYTNIRHLFDRRNRNTISHPSFEDKIAWAVTEEEYVRYRESVGECLQHILAIP